MLKPRQMALLISVGIVGAGIGLAAVAGFIAPGDVPYAFGVLLGLGALLFFYTALRTRDE
jgi:hypothetical protein